MKMPKPRFEKNRGKNGAWVVRVTLKDGSRKLRTLAPGPKEENKAIAEAEYHRYMSQRLGVPLSELGPPPPKQLTTLDELGDAFDEWVVRQVKKKVYKQRTLDNHRYRLGQFMDAMGRERAAELIPYEEIEDWSDSWSYITNVRAMYNYGMDKKLIENNPAAEVTKPTMERRMRILTDDEVRQLLERAYHPEFRNFMFAMLHTIARPQEVRKFRWGQLNEDDEGNWYFLIREFKGKHKRKIKLEKRVIPVSDDLINLIDELRKTRPTPHDDDHHVFVDYDGLPWTEEILLRQMTQTRNRAGIKRNEEGQISLYTFRHTGATTAITQGCDIASLSQIMGHSRITTTMVYVKQDQKHMCRMMNNVIHPSKAKSVEQVKRELKRHRARVTELETQLEELQRRE